MDRCNLPTLRRANFLATNPLNHSVAEVVRNHQLIEAWRRCQQTREMQSRICGTANAAPVSAIDRHSRFARRRQFIACARPERVRRLETVRRDFISNVSHELRTPLASLKALTETLQNGALPTRQLVRVSWAGSPLK
jgi:two-component system phosphate regulon sensor histidine kinase PhoR